MSAHAKPGDRVREPFADPGHQRDSAVLGIWTFLAQELVFFAALFSYYASQRLRTPEAFAAGSRECDWRLGVAMTALLLTSGATVVIASRSAALQRRASLVAALGLTLAQGLGFLVIKAVEYREHLGHGQTPWVADPVGSFWSVYYVLTAFHALHVLAGLAVFAALIVAALRRRVRSNTVLGCALYWHFVDVVWIFLFPLLYLIDPQP
ncbi:cytochrome c oxidase subunit 3 [Enhygromyxa salina]|uniref:Cytochrome c oxidase subunit 3 n=1 Tax=Enhygromyxa salina TaxID=215803 RepID=A0A2S9YPA5_9BACT|nr:cytochrome c oxidase subunit 3 [Enhygromyxa salina]PRQ06921.1 Cytochrome c oxidase subunit 3 [Enhygromyxa salina]